jgi:hypothetical protein
MNDTQQTSTKGVFVRHIMLSLALLAVMAFPAHAGDGKLEARIRHALKYAHQHYARTVAELKDTIAYPRSSTPASGWRCLGPDDWTSGFFPGILWYLSEWSGDSTLRAAAQRYTAGLESQQFNTGTHDIGFMMYCSFGNGLRITSSERYKEVLLRSAESLSKRFHPRIGCIKSWDWSNAWVFPVIIDNMMNLELLFWAARNGGGDRLKTIAVRHAETTVRTHFRSDGGTYHVVDFDTATGNVVRKQTHQGYADESVWARGQAWGLYGFTVAYRETEEGVFRDAAVRAAEYFLGHLPPDNVPYWDFQAPGIPNAVRDASAAAIAASGLLELSRIVNDPGLSVRYREGAASILASLTREPYLSEGTGSSGVLNHCTGNHPGGVEIDVSLIYGDYYFIEAMLRYLQRPN